jgi:hypothetical protein
MITREQYLQALEIADKYHRQFLPAERDPSKLTIREWLNLNSGKVSTRLERALITLVEKGFIYISDIHEFDMMRLHAVGSNTWREFIALRGHQ